MIIIFKKNTHTHTQINNNKSTVRYERRGSGILLLILQHFASTLNILA
jgi:hypothetical protein